MAYSGGLTKCSGAISYWNVSAIEEMMLSKMVKTEYIEHTNKGPIWSRIASRLALRWKESVEKVEESARWLCEADEEEASPSGSGYRNTAIALTWLISTTRLGWMERARSVNSHVDVGYRMEDDWRMTFLKMIWSRSPYSVESEESRSRKAKRRWWVRPINQQRKQQAPSIILFQELSRMRHDLRLYCAWAGHFSTSSRVLRDRLTKTLIREPISPKSVSSSHCVSWPPGNVAYVVRETCLAIYEVLQPQYIQVPKDYEEWERIARGSGENGNVPTTLGRDAYCDVICRCDLNKALKDGSLNLPEPATLPNSEVNLLSSSWAMQPFR
uniref:Uncharacterized protein n=1 Tax=Ditylenchus dipsaci TaxID=166011 RepID=A0A915EMS1_9BILA